MRWRTVGLLLGLSLVISVPALAANYVVKVGPPGGVDDTVMLQTALNYCASHGPGCVMQLTAGSFVTRQLFTQDFNGTIKGMGMDKTSIEAYAPLPVSEMKPCWSDAPTLWPELIQFDDGDISISDLAIRVTAPVATTEWFDDAAGEVKVHELVVVLRVTGEYANLSLNRVKIEGGLADVDTGIWGRLNTDYAVVAEPWNWPGPLVGTMSIKDSVFLNVNIGIAAYYLGSSKVTIGGSPSTGNLFEDVEVPITLGQLDGSSSEISYNNIIRTNWLGIELNQAPLEPTRTASRFVVEHNDITVVPTYIIDANWWPDAIDIWDWNWDDPTSVKSEFVVSHNTIRRAPNTGVGVGLSQDSGSIVSNNEISGYGWANISLDGSTQDMLLGNNVQHFTAEETPYGTFAPIWLTETTSNCTVVGGQNATDVVDLGTNNTLVGVNNMQGNPPGPSIRDAMKRKMEIIKSMRKP
jgi:hypothetical protein